MKQNKDRTSLLRSPGLRTKEEQERLKAKDPNSATAMSEREFWMPTMGTWQSALNNAKAGAIPQEKKDRAKALNRALASEFPKKGRRYLEIAYRLNLKNSDQVRYLIEGPRKKKKK